MVESTKEPVTGNLVWRQMVANPLLNHYGVFLHYEGDDLVIHKQSDTGQRITTLSEFLKGYELRGQRSTKYTGSNAIELILRFEEMPETDFNLFFNNCEKFAHHVAGEPYRAKEVDRAVYAVIAVAIVVLLLKDATA